MIKKFLCALRSTFYKFAKIVVEIIAADIIDFKNLKKYMDSHVPSYA